MSLSIRSPRLPSFSAGQKSQAFRAAWEKFQARPFYRFAPNGSAIRIEIACLKNRGASIMNWQERIVIDPAILVGKPVIKGTRLAVEFIIDLLGIELPFGAY
jgi:hypothetical protein